MTYLPDTRHVVLTDFTDVKARNTEYEMHGLLDVLVTAQPLNAVPTDLAVTNGISKLLIVVNAGSDLAGSITVTGTSVDRNTGAESGADTDTITVSGLTTDNSSTDANGVVVTEFANAYITTKWFRGAVTLSTADLTLTDVDVYAVAFNQMDDSGKVELDALDITAECTNTAGWISAYLYTVVVTGDTCVIVAASTIILTAANSEVKVYRFRRGALGLQIDCHKDGIFLKIDPGPLASNYWEDMSVHVWARSGGHFS